MFGSALCLVTFTASLCACVTLQQYLEGAKRERGRDLAYGLSVVAPALLKQHVTVNGALHTRIQTADLMLDAFSVAIRGTGLCGVTVNWMDVAGTVKERLQWLSVPLAAQLLSVSHDESQRLTAVHIALALVVPLQWRALTSDLDTKWVSSAMHPSRADPAVMRGLLSEEIKEVLLGPAFNGRARIEDLWRAHRIFLATANVVDDSALAASMLVELPLQARSEVIRICHLTRSPAVLGAATFLLRLAVPLIVTDSFAQCAQSKPSLAETVTSRVANDAIRSFHIVAQIPTLPVHFPANLPVLLVDLFDVLIASVMVCLGAGIDMDCMTRPMPVSGSALDRSISILVQTGTALSRNTDDAGRVQCAVALVHACATAVLLANGHTAADAFPVGMAEFAPRDLPIQPRQQLIGAEVIALAARIRYALLARSFACKCGVAVSNTAAGDSWRRLVTAERVLRTGIVSRRMSFVHATQSMHLFSFYALGSPEQRQQSSAYPVNELRLLLSLNIGDVRLATTGVQSIAILAQSLHSMRSVAIAVERNVCLSVLGHHAMPKLPTAGEIALVIASLSSETQSLPDAVLRADAMLRARMYLSSITSDFGDALFEALVAFELLVPDDARHFVSALYGDGSSAVASYGTMARHISLFVRWRSVHGRGTFSSIASELLGSANGAFLALLDEGTFSAPTGPSEPRVSPMHVSFRRFLYAMLAIDAWTMAAVVVRPDGASGPLAGVSVPLQAAFGWGAGIVEHYVFRTLEAYVAAVGIAIMSRERICDTNVLVATCPVAEREAWTEQESLRLRMILGSGGHVRFGVDDAGRHAEFLYVCNRAQFLALSAFMPLAMARVPSSQRCANTSLGASPDVQAPGSSLTPPHDRPVFEQMRTQPLLPSSDISAPRSSVLTIRPRLRLERDNPEPSIPTPSRVRTAGAGEQSVRNQSLNDVTHALFGKPSRPVPKRCKSHKHTESATSRPFKQVRTSGQSDDVSSAASILMSLSSPQHH